MLFLLLNSIEDRLVFIPFVRYCKGRPIMHWSQVRSYKLAYTTKTQNKTIIPPKRRTICSTYNSIQITLSTAWIYFTTSEIVINLYRLYLYVRSLTFYVIDTWLWYRWLMQSSKLDLFDMFSERYTSIY